MGIKQQVRQLEQHVRGLSDSRPVQLAIVSKAQGMVAGDEQLLATLILVKRRIYKGVKQ